MAACNRHQNYSYKAEAAMHQLHHAQPLKSEKSIIIVQMILTRRAATA